MIMYDILLIFQYQVSTTVMDLFVFMLVLLCFCVATEFSVNKEEYNIHVPVPNVANGRKRTRADGHFSPRDVCPT